MIPPIPHEKLPQWVQDKMRFLKTFGIKENFKIGDRVFDTLYGEGNGFVIDVDNEQGWIRVGWDLDPVTNEFRNFASGAIYYVKYDKEE